MKKNIALAFVFALLIIPSLSHASYTVEQAHDALKQHAQEVQSASKAPSAPATPTASVSPSTSVTSPVGSSPSSPKSDVSTNPKANAVDPLVFEADGVTLKPAYLFQVNDMQDQINHVRDNVKVVALLSIGAIILSVISLVATASRRR